MKKATIGFGLSGSYCTFRRAIDVMKELIEEGYEIVPIMSFNAYNEDTKFGKAQDFIDEIEALCGRKIIHTIQGAEPIGPQKMLDLMMVLPCTGNTLAKLNLGITDTPLTMAVKSHLRNGRPVLIGVSTNDGLSGAAKNIGGLLNYRNLYFIPFGEDAPIQKPRSLVADFEMTSKAIEAALEGNQIQPMVF